MNVLADRLDPMTVKEIRQRLRGNGFVIPFAVSHLFFIAVIAMEYFVQQKVAAGATITDWDYFVKSSLFWIVLGILLVLVVPLGGANALKEEIVGRNMELLLLTRLSRWRVVFGKWLTRSSIAVLMLLSVIPYILVRYFLGGMEFLDALGIVFVMMVSGFSANALVLGASGCRTSVGAVLTALSGYASFACSALAVIAPSWIIGIMPGRFDPTTAMCAVAVSALFVVIGLQLGRTQLRLFEYPNEPPPRHLVLVMMICSPVILAMLTPCTMILLGAGGALSCAWLIWVVWMLDPVRPRVPVESILPAQ